MTQMGGRITRPVTDEKKKKVTCFLVYCVEMMGLKLKPQVHHRVVRNTAASNSIYFYIGYCMFHFYSFISHITLLYIHSFSHRSPVSPLNVY